MCVASPRDSQLVQTRNGQAQMHVIVRRQIPQPHLLGSPRYRHGRAAVGDGALGAPPVQHMEGGCPCACVAAARVSAQLYTRMNTRMSLNPHVMIIGSLSRMDETTGVSQSFVDPICMSIMDQRGPSSSPNRVAETPSLLHRGLAQPTCSRS